MGKALIKCSGVAILLGAFQTIFFLGTQEEIPLSDIILMLGFSEVSINLVYLIELSIRLLPIFLFQIFFGTYIYQHFCSASIYYFSRCHNRVKWFLYESLKLYVLAFIYPLMMVFSGTALAGITNQIVFDGASLLLFIYYVLIHSLWLFLTALFMNVIAIKLDSSYAFTVIVVLQLASVSMLLLWEDIWPLVDTNNVVRHAFFLQFNPIAHLILSWHSSPILAVNERINFFNIDFSLYMSVITFSILTLIVLVLGCLVVKKQEWITLNRERGVI